MSVADSYCDAWSADVSDTRVARGAPSRVQESPSGRVDSFDTDDVDELNQHSGGWSVQYHVLNATAFRSAAFLVITPSLQVAPVQQAMGYSSQGDTPAGALSMMVRLDEARPMVFRGRSVGSQEMAVARSGAGFECVCRAGARFIVVSLPQKEVVRCASDLWHEPNLLTHSPDRLRFADSARRSRRLEACGRLLAAVLEQPLILGDERATALLEEKLLEGLLLNAHVAASGASMRSRSNLARKAYRYLQDRADQVPSIREICAATRASYATLERGFRETYGMTPRAMITAMRLSGARRTLLHPDPTTTVTAVALRWGFVEFGRFAAQYRQRYGEVPSATLRRVQGETPVGGSHRDGIWFTGLTGS
jgi:AraC family ethanolamine operon transcriptional activator